MRPRNVPARPDQVYKDSGWQGWVHWLGSGSSKKASKKASKFAPFNQALTHARSLNLATRTEWKAWCKEGMRPPNVPSNSQRTHKESDDGWQGRRGGGTGSATATRKDRKRTSCDLTHAASG